MKKLIAYFVMAVILTGCSDSGNLKKDRENVAVKEENENTTEKENIEKTSDIQTNNIVKENSVYECNIEEDKKNFNGNVDIVVGDKLYATQINDWYENFEEYEGKSVEIEGYYIDEFEPYTFVGRYGPSCPYCQGGYVCFEILTDEDLTGYQSGKDWIKVKGILREGIDNQDGPFCYLEVMKIEKIDKVGMDTVSD